ncbi:OLFR [Acanthosepion pharaonis]|uniref:OLFR n=1 Tax=Acanthosepion pharaonis TaxID=158019 RepID=A0A812D4D6_ACAPH|nr:OLFR [Sepia pharaonis]
MEKCLQKSLDFGEKKVLCNYSHITASIHFLYSNLFFLTFQTLLLFLCIISPSLFTSYIPNTSSFSYFYLPPSLPPFLLCLYSLHCYVITTLPVMLSNDFCFLYFASIVSNSSFPSLYFIPLSFQLLLPTYFLLNISSISPLTHSHSGNTHLYSFTSFFS